MNPRAAEFLEKIRNGEVPYPPMWQTVAVKVEEFASGRILLSTRADQRHINAFGAVHGGYVAGVLDTALGLTVFVSLEHPEARHTTIDLAVKIVKPVPLETELFVETSLVSLSRRLGVSQGVLRDTAGVVYAHGTTSCMVKPPA